MPNRPATDNPAILRAAHPGSGFSTRARFFRALFSGVVLGAMLSAVSVYVGLKVTFGTGLSLVAALLTFAVWQAVRGISFGRVTGTDALECNISQTAASSAATVATAGLATAVPALAILDKTTFPWYVLMPWTLAVMLVGISAAVLLRRRLIVKTPLSFPAGTVTAEMLRDLHAHGSAALRRAASLVVAIVVAVGVSVLAMRGYLADWPLPLWIGPFAAASLGFVLAPSLMTVGLGGLVGFRTAWSLLLGSLLAFAILGPALVQLRAIPHSATVPWEEELAAGELSAISPHLAHDAKRHTLTFAGTMTDAEFERLRMIGAGEAWEAATGALRDRSRGIYGSIARWFVWPASALMVVAGLLSMLVRWRAVAASRQTDAGAESTDTPADLNDIRRGWLIGLPLVAGGAAVALQTALFGINPLLATLAVLLTFALAMVAARVVGETGISTSGALGKISQLLLGAAAPSSPATNLLAANVTGGAASQCADLLDDFKCGHLLGASPRQQLFAQLAGAVVGAIAGTATYLVLITSPEVLGSTEWPAPSALVWRSVALVFRDGFGALPAGTPVGAAVATLLAGVLVIVETLVPARFRAFVPSPIALGVGMLVPGGMALGIFAGGLVAALAGRWFSVRTGQYLLPIFAGFLTGDVLLEVGAALANQLWQH